MRLLVTRPRDDAEPLAALLAKRRVESLIEPLLEVRFVDDPVLDLSGVQALLMTSANGARAFARASRRRDLPVFAVGDATARAAAGAGFKAVESAGGDVGDLAHRVRARLDPRRGALLHAAGTKVAGDLAGTLREAGFTYHRAVLYEAHAAEALTPAAAGAIAAGAVDGVVLFSPRTARTFVALAKAAGLAEACRGLTAYCLSRAVAAAAGGLAWRRVRVAARPEQGALLETVTADLGGA